MVYVLRQKNGRSSFIKIGHSVNVGRRIKDHATSSPVPLELLSLRDGLKKEETDLHSMLSEFRVSGEWFKDCPDVLSALDITEAPKGIARLRHYPMKKLDSYFYSNRYVAHDLMEIMAALGYHPDFWKEDFYNGRSFRVRKISMKDIPDRQYRGIPFIGEKFIAYASDDHEFRAQFYAKNPGMILDPSVRDNDVFYESLKELWIAPL